MLEKESLSSTGWGCS
uniref:Putative ATP-dependent helicase IRC20 n=1 Tax=Rhizophora mucronata TaxID=61149 RepID=A0A2P2JBW7_RHIMU